MITYSEIRQTLETYFQANWSKTLIAWTNAAVDITEDEFVRFTITWAETLNVTFGVTDTRKSGVINVQIYVPRDVGTGKAMNYADEIVAFMENKQHGKIFVYAGSYVDIGEGIRRLKDVEFGYYQLNVTFRFDAQ